MRFLRFTGTPKTPEPLDDTTFVFVDGSGVLKKMDEDGNVSSVGSGDPGVDGTPVWRGDWSAGSYDAGEAVAHDGSSYVANTTTSDEPPSSDWDVLAAKGEDGNGGSQTFKVERTSIAWDDAGIVVPGAGKVIYTPTAGEYLVAVTVNITTPWDGTTPAGWIYSTGDTYTSENLANITLDTASESPPSTGASSSTHMSNTDDINYAKMEAFFDDAAALRLVVDDGSGNDPGASQGEGEILLFIASAP